MHFQKVLLSTRQMIATRNMFYDEQGKHRRTKKEILDEQGNLRAGCSIIPKGEVYESHIFTKKEEWFKSDAFTREVKEMFTEIINSHVKERAEKLSVFQQGGVYLATKKIGKNNPKEAEIRADNEARQEWNPNFKPIEFDRFKAESGDNAFTLTPQQWIKATDSWYIKTGISGEDKRAGNGRCQNLMG